MLNLVFTSLRYNAGKTGVMAGIAQVLSKKIGYMKPFGDRLLYRKKRLWDFDSAVFTNHFNLDEQPEDMSMGFDHSKLRYMSDAESSRKKIEEMAAHNSNEKDVLLVEGGRNINCGMSINLDAITICNILKGKLVVITSGDGDKIIDDLTFLKQNVDLEGVKLGGVIINKVKDVSDFQTLHGNYLNELALPVLGVIPYREELSKPTVQFISDVLLARVLSGESAMNKTVREIFVGAMSADAILRLDRLKKHSKIIITSGDRSDMILAAIESNCVGIVLTNNILPPPNIIARAANMNIPLLLTKGDTFQIAKKIDQSVPLLSHTDTKKLALWKTLIEENIDWRQLL